MNKLALHWQILIAIVAGAALGYLTGKEAVFAGVSLYASYDFVGTMFLSALKMIIVPLVMASIVTGVANLGANGGADVGRFSGKTIGWYMASSLLAILLGLVLVNLFTPGVIDGKPAGDVLNLPQDEATLSSLSAKVEGKSSSDIVEVFVRMVPPNIAKAAVEGQMLGLIFFSALFGFFMSRLEGGPHKVMHDFWQGLFDVMMHITMFVMKFAPIGVFALVAKTVAATGFAAFKPMLVFFVTVALALLLHAFVTLPVLLKTVAGINPLKHIRAMSPAMLTAFSTASSSATLPVTMECVEERAGVSKKTASFVLPLGATINMDGTALYECVAAIFIAQAYGMDLTFGQQFLVVFTALVTSIGVAGIPSASLVAIAVILSAIGLPLEALGLLLVTDRILDMMRTAVNVFSDSCGAVVLARTEGEQTKLV